MSKPRVTETYSASAGGAAIGLVQWLLVTKVFHGNEPPAVTVAVYALLPGLLGGLAAFFTRRDSKKPEPDDPASPTTATTAAG